VNLLYKSLKPARSIIEPAKRELFMIVQKKKKSSRMSVVTLLGITFLSSMLPLQLSAQIMEDDLGLVDKMLEAKSFGLNLDKELDIHMRILRDLYPANILKIQDGKVQYSKGNKAKARGLFSSVKSTDANFREMVFTFFGYADLMNDTTGKKQAAVYYFESALIDSAPEVGTKRRRLLEDMANIYDRIVRDDPNDKKKVKYKAFLKVCETHNIDVTPVPPTEQMEKANNEAERIVMKDLGVDPKAKVDVKLLEELIAAQKEMEWETQDFWFFKGVIERARAQALLGQYDVALKTLNKYSSQINKIDQSVNKLIDADKKVAKKDKENLKKSSSMFAGVRYVKGLVFYLQATEMKNNKKMAEAQALLKGRTGAAAQFGLCIFKNKGSKESFKAILRYDRCRELDIEWFPKEEKRLRELSKKPFLVQDIDLGKSYYNLQNFPKAISYFDKYKSKGASKDGYDAIYFGLWSQYESGNVDVVDEYLAILGTRYISMNKKPKDWYTQSCLRLSGKYRSLKNEETDPVKKKEYEAKQFEYFKKSQTPGSATAPISYTLAYNDLKEAFKLKRERQFVKAKEKYLVAVKSFMKIIKLFPTSSEAVKSYKQAGLLHEYFKDFEKSRQMYLGCLKLIATPDVAGRVDKMDVMTSLANLEFLVKDYAATLKHIQSVEEYANSVSLKTSDERLLSRLKALLEKRDTLKIFSEDSLVIPKKKELRALKSDLKLNPEDTNLLAKSAAISQEIKSDLTKTIVTFKAWLLKYPESNTEPSALARLGSLYQELDDSSNAKKTYEKLRAKYPDHEIVKLISINIVRAHLKIDDYDSAADALSTADFAEIDDESLRYLITSFVIEEAPRGMGRQTVEVCSTVAIKVIDELRPRYVKAKKDINRLHWLDYRKARSLYNLNKMSEAKSILDIMVKEKPLGPYIFDVKYLLGAIAAKQKNYVTVGMIYGSLKGLSGRMPFDLNREVRISAEWASAYVGAEDASLLKKARGISMMTKDSNVEKLNESGQVYVQKAGYLYILYNKKMKVDIGKMKQAYLQKYPTSPYAFKVRKL
jgi:tetratricopeptide (TPR) repeat protein